MTPGPWHRDDKGGLRGANNEPIYFKGADAVLMESAPEMLKALKVALHGMEAQEPDDKYRQARRVVEALVQKVDVACSIAEGGPTHI